MATMGIDDDVSITENSHEDLPFAVSERPLHEESPVSLGITSCSASESLPAPYGKASNDLSSSSNVPPQLVSSFMTDGESQESSSNYGNSSLLQHDSHYLDAAASLLGGSLLGGSAAALQQSRTSVHDSMSVSPTAGENSVAFSQLLHQADDRNESIERSSTGRLPALPEEPSVTDTSRSATSSFFTVPASVQTPTQSTCAGATTRGDRANNWLSGNLFHTNSTRTSDGSSSFISSSRLQETIVPASMEASATLQSQQQQQQPDRRLASLAGATARATGDSTFTVSIDIVVPCSVQDVMDVIGNPDLLHLWCDPVTALVITKSSEGARSATNRARDAEANREYEGEWIEATTNQLLAPSNTSFVYSTTRALSVAMGFPTYGKATMFVERQRGKVGLTLGPFPGGCEVLHRIAIEAVDEQRLRLTDQVRIQRETDQSEPSFCGLFSLVEKCFLPRTEDYMDQVLSSMARLRFLVENGETQASAPVCSSEKVGTFAEPLLSP